MIHDRRGQWAERALRRRSPVGRRARPSLLRSPARSRVPSTCA